MFDAGLASIKIGRGNMRFVRIREMDEVIVTRFDRLRSHLVEIELEWMGMLAEV